MKYTKEQLQKALNDFNRFINMVKDAPKGVPIRLLIVRDLIEEKLKND